MSHSCSVLIVESDAKALETAAPLLKSEVCKVSYVKQGLNVVTHLQKKDFDLVLLSDTLSDEPGYRVLRRIREKEGLKDLPVLMMISSPQEIGKALENGATDYLLKPVNPLLLKARTEPYVSRIIDRKRFQDECKKKDQMARRLDEAFTEMEIMSRLDPLTRVYNRRTFLEKISDEQIRSRRNQKKFSLLLINLVNCRRFNERHGYECGDLMIKNAAGLIDSTVRERDLTARWSGDKFMILLPETETDGLETLQEKISGRFMESKFEYKGMSHRIDVSFSARVCSGSDDLDTVLKEIE